MTITNRTCRYIAGAAGVYECQEPRAKPSPYCARHHALCYVKGTNRGRWPISLPIDKLPAIEPEVAVVEPEVPVPDTYEVMSDG